MIHTWQMNCENFDAASKNTLPYLLEGVGASAYEPVIRAIGAVQIDDMPTFRTELEALRAQQNASVASEES